MFLSNTRLKLVRLLVWVASVSNVEETVRCVYRAVLNFCVIEFACFATRLKVMAANIPPLKNKKLYTQNFKEWLEDPELKDWLR